MKKIMYAFFLIPLAFLSCGTLGGGAAVDERLQNIENSLDKQNNTLERMENDLALIKIEEGVENVELIVDTENGQAIALPVIVQYEMDDKIILGEKEMAFVEPPGELFDSRIDTGATTSSIHATDIVRFERDGKDWVRFNMNHDGTDRIIERPIVTVLSVQQTNSATPAERIVVSLFFKIAELEIEADFTLADRSRMTFPVLVGRNVMRDLAIVDVSYEYLHETEVD